MKTLTPYWFTPRHQKKGAAEPVEFLLEPIDLPTHYDMTAAINEKGVISAAGAQLAFRRAVKDWRGLPMPFSPEEKEVFLRTPGQYRVLWLMAVAGESFRRASLEEDEAKNS